MDPLVYPRERSLSVILLVLGLLVWVALIAGTLGLTLIYVLLGFLGYVFAQSAWVAHIRGSAVRVTAEQFPDLHDRLQHCCQTLAIRDIPETYILHGNGVFNAMAARFFGRHFVVLLSDVVDALDQEPEGINFYIGHELGHIRLKHLTGRIWRMPASWLPLLGAAYSRAKEYSCDRHGRACCANPESAARALTVLGAGAERWKTLNLEQYTQQLKNNLGFWGSFHELNSGYPWLNKRVSAVLNPERKMPKRNPWAYVLGIFIPFGGRAGGGAAGVLVMVAIIGMLAAIALPAYQDYTVRAKVNNAIQSAGGAQTWLKYRMQSSAKAGPLSRDEAQKIRSSVQLNATVKKVGVYALGSYADIVLTLADPIAGNIYLYSTNGGQTWICGSDDIANKHLPASCRDAGGLTRPVVSSSQRATGASLWSVEFGRQTMNSCVKERGKADTSGAEPFCECMVAELSSSVPKSLMQQSPLPAEASAKIEAAAQSCNR